jgi:hypothetical protein
VAFDGSLHEETECGDSSIKTRCSRLGLPEIAGELFVDCFIATRWSAFTRTRAERRQVVLTR